MELDSPASELNHWGFTLHFGIAGFGIGRDSRAGLGHFCSSAQGLQTARDLGCGVGVVLPTRGAFPPRLNSLVANSLSLRGKTTALFYFNVLAAPRTCRSFRARDGTRTAAVTTLDP